MKSKLPINIGKVVLHYYSVQIKITMGYTYTLTKMAKIKEIHVY